MGLVWGRDNPQIIAFVALLPLSWLFAPSRLSAFLLALGYYLSGSRCLPAGVEVFFLYESHSYQGFLIWIFSSFLLAMPWTLFWTPPEHRTCFQSLARLFLVFLVLTVPPLGVIGWGSPLMAACWIFGGLGFVSLALLLGSCVVIFHSLYEKKLSIRHVFMKGVVTALFFAFLLFINSGRPVTDPEWSEINTNYGRPPERVSQLDGTLERSLELLRTIREAKTPYILIPEHVIGLWAPAIRDLLSYVEMRLKMNRQTLAICTEVYDESLRYDNTLMFIGAEKGSYRERFPVPISMWKPWASAGAANAHWFESGLINTGNAVYACLICYEQILAFPVLWSFFCGTPQTIIASENHWWSEKTIMPLITRQSLISWTKLFNVKYAVAKNL